MFMNMEEGRLSESIKLEVIVQLQRADPKPGYLLYVLFYDAEADRHH